MLNHNYIGTEHLLLGLIHEGEGVAAKALDSLGISLESVRQQVEEIIGQGQAAPPGHIPFTPRAKKVLELSLREALQLGHNYIGTEHMLLGLIREGEGVAAKVLQVGADLNKVRQHVINLLSGYTGTKPLFLQEIDEKIAAAVTEKDAALDEGDLDKAVHARTEERRLLEERAAREREWMSPLLEIDEKIAEIRRLKEAAIDEQDEERAALLRDQEQQLLEERSKRRLDLGP